MSNQFIRKCGLIVYGLVSTGLGAPSSSVSSPLSISPGAVAAAPTPLQPAIAPAQPGLDLSQFRIQFKVAAMDVDVPPTAIIRVYNLAASTAQQIQNEFQNVVLQAGYQNGNFGVIFQGSIIRIRKGRVSNIDSFVDIMASNLDAIYNFGVVSKSVAASGTSYQGRLSAVAQGVQDSPAAAGTPNALAAGVKYGNIPSNFGTGGVLPRGKVLFGLAREKWTELANSQQCHWSVGPDGSVNFIPDAGYLPGQAVVINAQTGMIGVPEATQQGIEVRTLLNPSIKLGTQIQLDNASINTTTNLQATGFPDYSNFAFFANTSSDGTYRVLVAEHEGDTRGTGDGSWVTKITALSLDPSASPTSSVTSSIGALH